jgi:cytochrome c peroxidase
VIRVSLAVPSTADFTIQNIQDPYNCAETTTGKPAEYRRPLPSTNLGFLATVMWDGRETVKGQAMSANLSQQAIDATLGHAEATSAPTADQVSQIVALETAMYTAQAFDNNAKSLTSGGAKGGPVSLSSRPFHIGINDVLGQDPAGTAFTPVVFDEFSSWSKAREDSSDARRSVTHAGKLCSTHCPSPLPASRG